MPVENDWQRCELNDPRRCQTSNGNGSQCLYLSKPGSDKCPRHSAKSDVLAAQRAANAYKLNIYQNRMTEFTTNSEIKNLRAEIGILRMTLESIINGCQNEQQLLAYSGKISDMVIKIKMLVTSCQFLETKLGMQLDRDKVMLIGQRIVEIVSASVPDPTILDNIGEQIVAAIMEISVGEAPEQQESKQLTAG